MTNHQTLNLSKGELSNQGGLVEHNRNTEATVSSPNIISNASAKCLNQQDKRFSKRHATSSLLHISQIWNSSSDSVDSRSDSAGIIIRVSKTIL